MEKIGRALTVAVVEHILVPGTVNDLNPEWNISEPSTKELAVCACVSVSVCLCVSRSVISNSL